MNIIEILRHSLLRYDQYDRFKMVTMARSTVAPDGNTTTEDDYETDLASDIIEQMPASSGKYLKSYQFHIYF